jgi:hypothetical protein
MAGIAAGLLVAMLLPRDESLDRLSVARTTLGDMKEGAVERELVDLRRELADQRTSFAQSLERLASEVASLQASVSALGGVPQWSAPTQGDIQRRTESAAERVRASIETARAQMEDQEAERLLEAGFTQERIDWIRRRSEELSVEATQRLYAARNGGAPIQSQDLVRMINRNGALRDELGDVEYERYLAALGRPTSVRITQVLAASPAEQAGLRPGDEVVSYDGKRVFHAAELTALPLEGTADQPILVDIRRDGQMQQVVVPRRPLGVTGSILDELISVPNVEGARVR